MLAMAVIPVNVPLRAFDLMPFVAVLTAMRLDAVAVQTVLRTVFATFLMMNAGFKAYEVYAPVYLLPVSPLDSDYAVAMENTA